MPINWLYAIFWSFPMKSASVTHIPHSGLSISSLFRLVTNIYQILISSPCKPERPPCVVSWSRWWANCICRSSATSMFVFVCTSSSRLAVCQLKAAFILAHLMQESSCNNDNQICNCRSIQALCFRRCTCTIYAVTIKSFMMKISQHF